MLDYCSIILTVHAALWVGGGYTGPLVHVRRAAVSMESSTKEHERAKAEGERGEDAEKCEHGEGHGRGAVKKH